MESDALERRISQFARWHYRFEFDGGVATPLMNLELINRHEQRRRYFFTALLDLYGGSLQGQRVLDLGCNAGYWALQAARAGADFVLGIDAERECVEQAELVFEAMEIDGARYRFEHGDVFTQALTERFDVVLCLGLIDHVARPVELFERMVAVGADVIVIDTGLARVGSSYFELAALHRGRHPAAPSIALIPTREAVLELAQCFGYSAVPLARNMTDYTGLKDYRDRRRLAFVCSKNRSLQELPVEQPAPASWWLRALDPARRMSQLRG